MAILQPSSTSPIRHRSGMTTSVKKTSLNSASPVICRSGLTSTPGDDMSRMKHVMPLWRGRSDVRARSRPNCAMWPIVVQTLWPLRIHESPSRTALDRNAGRSDPAPGSLNSWHHSSSHVKTLRKCRRRWSSLANMARTGATIPIAPGLACMFDGTPIDSRPSSTSDWSSARTPSPPHPSG